jgi:hypothetical protein
VVGRRFVANAGLSLTCHRRGRYPKIVAGEGLRFGLPKQALPRKTHVRAAHAPAASLFRSSLAQAPSLLIEPRSDEGPTSVDEKGNAECEHDDVGTGHSVSRKCGNVVGFDARRFNVGLRLMLLPWAGLWPRLACLHQELLRAP